MGAPGSDDGPRLRVPLGPSMPGDQARALPLWPFEEDEDRIVQKPLLAALPYLKAGPVSWAMLGGQQRESVGGGCRQGSSRAVPFPGGRSR